MKLFRHFKILFFIGYFLIPLSVFAHPHSFIALKTQFYIEKDELIKLHFSWTMDELTSSFLKLEYQQDPTSVYNDLMSNIVENDFFSKLSLKSGKINTPIILMPQMEEATLSFNDEKAVVNFWLKLKNPLTVHNNQFELITYEKTFYVDMFYNQEADVESNNSNCFITINTPKPNDSIISYAKELDENDDPIETDDFILGEFFAQKVTLLCQ